MFRCVLPVTLFVVFFSVGTTDAQVSKGSTDLISRFNSEKFPISGDWLRTTDGLRVAAQKSSRTVLAESLPRNYQLDIELTRVSGEDVIAVILPVGDTSVALELSSWGGEAHGLARVDEQTSKSTTNPTSVRPGNLENGRRYQLEISVSAGKDACEVKAQLDGKKLINWKGPATRLLPHLVFNLPEPFSLGLASSQNEVVFHKIDLTGNAVKSKQPETPLPSSPKRAEQIQLSGLTEPQTPGWQPFNGAQFAEASDDDQEAIVSVPNAGTGDRGAFIKDLEFTNGTIDVDLRGDARPQQSFVGVVFHGVDGQTYESVYFRTFNFGSSDSNRRAHAVQYISHPEWPWERLRSERSGQFEKSVSPEPESADWFHARIEVLNDTVRVFVDGSDRSCLHVKRLTERRSGKVGVWFNGIAAFRNFRVSALTDETLKSSTSE